jgi:hypothetical protein
VVVDNYKARLWAEIFPHIKDKEGSCREQRQRCWAVRKNSPLLLAEINDAPEIRRRVELRGRGAANTMSARPSSRMPTARKPGQFESVIAIFKNIPTSTASLSVMAAQGFRNRASSRGSQPAGRRQSSPPASTAADQDRDHGIDRARTAMSGPN